MVVDKQTCILVYRRVMAALGLIVLIITRTYALVGRSTGINGFCKSWRRYGAHCYWWA